LVLFKQSINRFVAFASSSFYFSCSIESMVPKRTMRNSFVNEDQLAKVEAILW